MSTLARQWRFKSVAPAEAGDFVQITFADAPDSIDHYVLLSTQFEFPQDYDLQIEVDGGEWHAQLTVTEATLSRTTLTIYATEKNKQIELVIKYAADEGRLCGTCKGGEDHVARRCDASIRTSPSVVRTVCE